MVHDLFHTVLQATKLQARSTIMTQSTIVASFNYLQIQFIDDSFVEIFQRFEFVFTVVSSKQGTNMADAHLTRFTVDSHLLLVFGAPFSLPSGRTRARLL